MAKKKNYFNNDDVTAAILEYKDYLEKGENRIYILHPYTEQIQKLVRGVINTHKIYRWWDDVDELVQEGMLAIYASFKRFDPEKGTAFNYLSIVAKQHLKNWTQTRNKKAWNTFEFQEDLYEEKVEFEPGKTEGFMVMENVLHMVDVPIELEKTLEAIVGCVVLDGLDNKRDIVKHLTKQAWIKEDVDAVFAVLEVQLESMNAKGRTRKEE